VSLGNMGFHAVSFAGVDAGWAVGEGGRIGKYIGATVDRAKQIR
jgi:hypothetical protein